MANAKTRLQQKAAKERRKKYFAIGGSIVLAAVLVIQVPRTMKMLNGPADENAAAASESAPTAPDTAGAVPEAVAAPTGLPVSAAAPGELPDRNAEPAPEDGQLMSFERFEGKDPFVQQVTDTAAEEAAAAAAGQTSAPATAAPTSGAQTQSSSSSQTTGGRKLSAVISVNGTQETVAVAHAFPADNPTFRLVSAGAGAAKIGIAGGTLAGGGRTVTLKVGRKLTLVNTADGTRYVLALRSVQ
jgi:hypothetical protein